MKADEQIAKYQADHKEFYGDDDGRLDTINDEDDDFDDNMAFDDMDLGDDIGDVAVHIQPEYDDIKDDIEARFKKGGFEMVETQSQSIMRCLRASCVDFQLKTDWKSIINCHGLRESNLVCIFN